MKFRWSLGLCAAMTTLTATTVLSGCDEGEGGTDSVTSQTFREGEVQVYAGRQTSATISIKGCEPPFPIYRPGTPLDEAPEAWREMLRTQTVMNAESTLVAVFLAASDVEEHCSDACHEAGSTWDGGAAVAGEAQHEIGESTVIGVCPNDTLATSSPVWSEAEVGCTCVD